ncbi:MAG TPA: rod shape-determining protein RodA [bacterium]|nr:rod shape-determining protein RodA [bacterium]HPP30139.1 rod shape-determining protein RodA [bacterium]
MLRYFKRQMMEKGVIFWASLLLIIGVLMLFSASKGVLVKESIFLKQCLWIIIATIAGAFIKKIDYRDFQRIAPPLYFIIIFLLVAVLFSWSSGGASRWIRLGVFNLQPSEFAKLITVITLAAYLAEKDIRRFPVLLVSLIIIGIPFLLVLKQPNLGTAFIFIVVFFAIIYQAGATKGQMISLFLIGIFSSPFMWFIMKPYQRERILTFINPMRDPLGKGYNLIQSIITIGSGGFFGKGFLRGTQTKLAFLPEYHTDFIFCAFAEEFGFIGVVVLLGIYFMFFKSIAEVIYYTRERFAKLLATGILVIFIAHVVINTGMTMGLFPVVGIPLPFISYGGSSLMVSLISVVLVANIKENTIMF